VTIKVSGHPLFSLPVILNGHENVAGQAHQAGINFTQDQVRNPPPLWPIPKYAFRTTRSTQS
jgi:hypothetical protein